MIQVSILKNGVVTNQAQWETRELADSWIAQGKLQEWWGKSEWIETIPATEDTPEHTIVHPAEFTIEVTDITSQVEQEKINAESLAYLASTDWMIIRETETGVLCPPEVKTKRAEARAKVVK